jgi:hypothetical protein
MEENQKVYNDHASVIQFISDSYHINECKSLNDLNEYNKRKLGNLILNDFDHFDPAELILYNPDENMITLLENLLENKIDEKQFIQDFYSLLLKGAQSSINEIFDEINSHFKLFSINNSFERNDFSTNERI